MKALYFDTFAGLSGDKTVGAMLDLGFPIEGLRSELGRLPLAGLELEVKKVLVGAISATRFEVRSREAGQEQALASIRAMLRSSSLSSRTKKRAIGVFELLAQAEGKVHGVPADEVHFHEVGAVDSIADIVGACLGLEALGIERVLVGPLPLGGGFVETAHGPLPVPAPATVELLRRVPVRFGVGEGEMVTPTGAALLAGFGAQPVEQVPLLIERVGYGAGARRLADRPNVLRLVLGELQETREARDCEIIEANIDDLNPEFYEYVAARLSRAGALDVSLLPVQMKKGRPGTVLSVISPEPLTGTLADIILEETSTLGLRIRSVRRTILGRRAIRVSTPHGEIQVKVAARPSGRKTVAPEYEDCARAAEATGVPLAEVYEAAVAAARALLRAEDL